VLFSLLLRGFDAENHPLSYYTFDAPHVQGAGELSWEKLEFFKFGSLEEQLI
jgi:hypothetical protein